MKMPNWKDAYKDQWATGNAREKLVAEAITKVTGASVESVGFGAGSTRYIHGSAEANGYRSGGADLSVKGTNIEVEVTGTDKGCQSDDLWIRPDKIANALKQKSKEIWVAHVLDTTGLVRAVRMDEQFLRRYSLGFLKQKSVRIRGNMERFIAIRPGDSSVMPFAALLRRIEITLQSKSA